MYRLPAYDTRPVMPTSSTRMIKPGIHSSSTFYIAPKVKTVEHNEVFERPTVAPYPVVSDFKFTAEEIANPPTCARDGMSREEELKLRRVGTMYIKELHQKLNSPQFINDRPKVSTNATSVAIVFYQRFFMYQSFATFDPLSTAAAALFLACKSEECPRKMQEFAMLLYKTKNPEDPYMLEPSETEDVCNLIQSIESAILRTLAFELKMELPHIEVIKSHANTIVKKTSFQLCTDALAFSTFCLFHDNQTIAAGMLYMASCYHNTDLTKEMGPLWFESFNRNITEELLIMMASDMNRALKEIEPMVNANLQDIVKSSSLPQIKERVHAALLADQSRASSSASSEKLSNETLHPPLHEKPSSSMVKNQEHLVVPHLAPPRLASPHVDNYGHNGYTTGSQPIKRPIPSSSHIQRNVSATGPPEELSMPSLIPAPLPPPNLANHKHDQKDYECSPAKRPRPDYNIARSSILPTVKLEPPMFAFQPYFKAQIDDSKTVNHHIKKEDLEEGEIE